MITDRDNLIINALQSNLDGINAMYEATDELGEPIWDQLSLLKDKETGIAALAAYREELQSQPPAKPDHIADPGNMVNKPEPRGDARELVDRIRSRSARQSPTEGEIIEFDLTDAEAAQLLASSQGQGDNDIVKVLGEIQAKVEETASLINMARCSYLSAKPHPQPDGLDDEQARVLLYAHGLTSEEISQIEYALHTKSPARDAALDDVCEEMRDIIAERMDCDGGEEGDCLRCALLASLEKVEKATSLAQADREVK